MPDQVGHDGLHQAGHEPEGQPLDDGIGVSTLRMNGVWWLYGMNAREGSFSVMINEPSFPMVMEPSLSYTPIAYAELIVQALKACSGVSLMQMQPNAITNLMSPLGDDPGL